MRDLLDPNITRLPRTLYIVYNNPMAQPTSRSGQSSLRRTILALLGVIVLLVGFQAFRSWQLVQQVASSGRRSLPVIRLNALAWLAQTGFSPQLSAGLDSRAPGVIRLPTPVFPVRLNEIFHTPPASGLHDYTLATTFLLEAQDLQPGLALYLPELGENWAVYLNGRLLRQEVYLDATGERILVRRSVQSVIITLSTDWLQAGPNQLVFRMIGSSDLLPVFTGWTPGFPLTEGYQIAAAADLFQMQARRNALAMLQIGLYMFFGLYLLIFFLRQPRLPAFFYQGIIMLGFGASWQFGNSPLAFSLYPDTSLITRLSYLSAAFAGFLLPMVWHILFQDQPLPKLLRWVNVYLIGLLLCFLAVPFEWLEPLLRSYLFLLALFVLIGVWVVWLGWRQSKVDSGKLAVLMLVMAGAASWDLLDIQVLHSGMLTTPFLPFFLSIVFAFILINRFRHLSNQADDMRLELTRRNQELQAAQVALEAQVEQRTAELRAEIERREQAQLEAENRAVEAETLRQAGEAVIENLDRRAMAERILDQLARVVPFDSASVQMRSSDGLYSDVVGGRGFADMPTVLRIRLPLDEKNPATQVYQTCQPRLIADVPREFRWFHHPDFTALSWLCVPMLYQGETIGVLTLDSQQPSHFTPRHAQLVSAFAGPVALALKNAQIYEQVRQGAEELAMFYDIGLTITAGLDMNSLLNKLHDQVRRFAQSDSFFVALYDEDTQTIVFPFFVDKGELQTIPVLFLKDHPGLTSWVVENRKTLYLPDTLVIPDWLDIQPVRVGGELSRSFVGTPLALREKVIGVMSMQAYEPNAYTHDQIRLFETLASQAAIAIDNSRLYGQVEQELVLRNQAEKLLYDAYAKLQEQFIEIQGLQATLREQAIRDSVTGLFNRRYMEETLEREIARAQRETLNLGLIMFDIDHFKIINDTYGHKAGDLVVAALGKLLLEHSRSMDVACRYGGEEFLLILPGSNLSATRRRAEELRNLVEEMTTTFDDIQLQVTVSLGLAVYPEHGRNIDVLIRRADISLYQAKQTGRNRVVG